MELDLQRFYNINRRVLMWVAFFAILTLLHEFFAVMFLTFIFGFVMRKVARFVIATTRMPYWAAVVGPYIVAVGLLVLLTGLGTYLWTLAGGLLFAYARPLAMLVTLLGAIILLCGLPVLRYVWLPWLYLFFAIPIPQRIYFAMTDPLRRMAATVAATVLGAIPGLGLDLRRVGSNLEYTYGGTTGVIGVADACSGMRSTVTLCALGVAVAFMSERPAWQRVILVLACVPIATFCNFIRVTVTCWLHVFVDPKYASGEYHMMFGLVVILLAFGIFSGLGWVLNRLFVEEPESEATPR